jgi:hypothetical protein
VTYVDEFRVVRSGNATYFFDDFGDGAEPPVVPAGSFNCTNAPNCYALAGSFNADDEAGGKLRMDSALGDPTESALGNPRILQRVTLTSNRSDDPADISAGLKRHRVFSASVLYDLVVPAPGEQMHVRFNDAHADPSDAGHRDNYVTLSVRRATAPGAEPVIRFFEQNFVAGTLTEIDATPLNLALGADQIRLTLSHPVADSNEIYGSWEYLQAGAVVGDGSFATPGNIFNGETWTRTDFGVSAVPEPHAYALMLAGIGMVAWRLRRRIG